MQDILQRIEDIMIRADMNGRVGKDRLGYNKVHGRMDLEKVIRL